MLGLYPSLLGGHSGPSLCAVSVSLPPAPSLVFASPRAKVQK